MGLHGSFVRNLAWTLRGEAAKEFTLDQCGGSAESSWRSDSVNATGFPEGEEVREISKLKWSNKEADEDQASGRPRSQVKSVVHGEEINEQPKIKDGREPTDLATAELKTWWQCVKERMVVENFQPVYTDNLLMACWCEGRKRNAAVAGEGSKDRIFFVTMGEHID